MDNNNTPVVVPIITVRFGYTPSAPLPFVDGADLRKPEFASYSAEERKWIIEGTGVEPDIAVDNDPILEYAGTDQQLNKAIEVILQQLKDYKEQPAIPEAPDKSK